MLTLQLQLLGLGVKYAHIGYEVTAMCPVSGSDSWYIMGIRARSRTDKTLDYSF